MLAAALLVPGCGGSGEGPDSAGQSGLALDRFDASRAFGLITEQVKSGQRPAGSPTLRRLARSLQRMLPNGSFEPAGAGLRNVVGTLPGRRPAIVVGAHYDTEASPPGFVGANDGAAGTAAVVELARALEEVLPPGHREVRFVLFDGEEEPAGCPPAEFIACGLRGSKAYVRTHLAEIRRGAIGELILLDYVANDGLTLPREANSDAALWGRLRDAATTAGAASRFPDREQAGIIDDHYPFLLEGVTAIDLIDFSYPHRDTVEDTVDKLDPAALDAVGESVAELVLRLAAEGA